MGAVRYYTVALHSRPDSPTNIIRMLWHFGSSLSRIASNLATGRVSLSPSPSFFRSQLPEILGRVRKRTHPSSLHGRCQAIDRIDVKAPRIASNDVAEYSPGCETKLRAAQRGCGISFASQTLAAAHARTTCRYDRRDRTPPETLGDWISI